MRPSDRPGFAPPEGAETSEPAPMVVRRGKAPVVVQLVAAVAAVAVMSAVAITQPDFAFYSVVYAMALVIPAAIVVPIWLRSSTEIGREGILNRRLRGEELIAWPDVTRVMPVAMQGSVVVIVRGGRNVRLAGARGKRPKAGPSLDEIVDVVKAFQTRYGRPAGSTEPGAHAVATLLDSQARRNAAMPGASAPDVIRRKPKWVVAMWALIAYLAFVGLGLAVVAVLVTPWFWLAAVPFLVLTGLLVGVMARSRTEIGPDGIRNRYLGGQRLIPWADIKDVMVPETPPRYIQIVRRDGEQRTLSSISDAGVHEDGLGLDDIAEVIRHRAGLDEVSSELPGEAPVDAPAGPLSLRPSRWPLLWVLPLAALLAALYVLGFGEINYLVATMYLPVFVCFLAALAFKLLRGRTEVRPEEGLRNRLTGPTREIAWKDVDRLVVVPTLFGRIVQVARRGGKRVALAAPREGLLGRDPAFETKLNQLRALGALERPEAPRVERVSAKIMRPLAAMPLVAVIVFGTAMSQPWNDPWWPTRDEATALPRACTILDAPARQRMVKGAAPHINNHDDFLDDVRTACQASDYKAGLSAELTMELDSRSGFSSGTDEARRTFTIKRDAKADSRPLGKPTGMGAFKLGDEAWREIQTENGSTTVNLIARKGNVIIEVTHTAKRPETEVVAEAEALARKALAEVDFR